VITAGANGIGRELVLNLLSKGAQVAAAGLNLTGLDETERLADGAAERMSDRFRDRNQPYIFVNCAIAVLFLLIVAGCVVAFLVLSTMFL
jgi:NAD(P)-dependent dehydrogenase (short-subunit alcohol dehydrogenase family)